jgi:carboxylesterase type B
MDQCVIVVTINYRLNVYGFLSTQDKVISGNMGLKDQRLALLWVKKNIHYFNGNPELITLGGIGSGAASVQYHLVSPSSYGESITLT